MEQTGVDAPQGIGTTQQPPDPAPHPITGYRNLSEHDIQQVNRIKAMAEDVGKVVKELKSPHFEYDQRWLAIAMTDLQTGFMALCRAVTKPTTF